MKQDTQNMFTHKPVESNVVKVLGSMSNRFSSEMYRDSLKTQTISTPYQNSTLINGEDLFVKPPISTSDYNPEVISKVSPLNITSTGDVSLTSPLDSVISQTLPQPNPTHSVGDGHNHSKPTTSGNKRYNSLSNKSRSFYDGFKNYMQKTHGLGINLASGGRTQAEQNYLYGQGRTRPGNKVTWTKNSHHIGGNAMDIVGPNWYKDSKENLLVANSMRKYSEANPSYGAGFLKLSKDPNHVQFVY